MEKLKKILASTKTTIILFIIILVLSLICKETVVYRFETLASYLYGTDADNAKNGADCYSKNGDAVTVLTWQS